ncbi:glycerophosphodiester phosphodiesterase family protein [Streptomyces sp. SID3343]|uniref:glycerophosphodiester phosphodiesterase n=1 Tax=Streptomyces sp. SID3343 TaxID=2690260 RepID=UPI00136BD8CF|nr:glycerophosphodiester phosphodiesterase family protein [Streptomyces sp. SID3343]MYV97834.1 glycerophosphodiester phosphodiesterase [Streptomyces sp. SID3343]
MPSQRSSSPFRLPRRHRSRLRAGALVAALGIGTTAALAGVSGAASADSDAARSTGEVVVSEDFSGAALPAGWQAVEGDWKVENGRLVGNSANSAQQSRITFGRHLADYRFEAVARFESAADSARWTAFGLDVPATGATPWSIATMRTGTTAANGLEFAQRTTGNAWNVTDTGSAPTAAGTGRDVKVAVEVHDNRARLVVDGREALRTTRVQRTADGAQALLVNGARVSFDDVKVTKLAPEENSYLRAPGAALTVVAHRGASSAAPENTLISDETARRAGADWIENDVQPSKDGVPHIVHDDTVDRTTNGKGRVRDLTSAQLAALDAGSWFSPLHTGARVPTLRAQLDDLRTRGGNLLLEIKGKHTKDEVARIVRDVRDTGMSGRVFVQSFEVDALEYTRELAPDLPLGLLRGDLDADPVALAKKLGLKAYNPSAAGLAKRPGAVADLHRAGVAVMVWTVDDAPSWKTLEAGGADAIITNRPAELAGWNAAWRQGGTPVQPAAPTVKVLAPAAGALVERAANPVPALDTTGAESVRLTLDGKDLAAGTPIDSTTLALGAHTLRAEAKGPGGTTVVDSTFTVTASRPGLAYLILTSNADRNAVATLTTMVAHDQYEALARWADNQAGRTIPADRARLIAGDARALI